DGDTDLPLPTPDTALSSLPLTATRLATMAQARIEAQAGGNTMQYLRRCFTDAGLTPQTLTYSAAAAEIDSLAPVDGSDTFADTTLDSLAQGDAEQLAAQFDQWLVEQQAHVDCRPIEILELTAMVA